MSTRSRPWYRMACTPGGGTSVASRRSRITRAGDSRTRHLLVQASQRIRYSRVPETLGLRTWAKRIEARRGRAVATVALARKVAGILFAMLRDGTPFDPTRQTDAPAAVAAQEGERPGLVSRAAGLRGFESW